jgi:hypothetical protein
MVTAEKNTTCNFPRSLESTRFVGMFIPRDVYLTPLLTAQEKLLLMEIDTTDLSEHTEEAYNDYMSRFLISLHPSNILDMISKLKRLGLVKRIRNKSGFYVLQSCPENFKKLTSLDFIRNFSCEALTC